MTPLRDRLRPVLSIACFEGQTIWIGGAWSAAAGGDTFAAESPIDGSHLLEVSRGGAEDIDRAVRSCRSAASAWWNLGGARRAEVLRGIATGIRYHGDELGMLETLDSGRPISETTGPSVAHSAELFDYYAGLADKLHGATVPMGSKATALVEREPIGVVGAISPWNYPLLNAATKIAPIIACGNAMVLKPAEQTSLVTMLLARIMKERGLPDGVVNIVTGLGTEAGAPLVEHPGVGKVSFTGSTATGRRIAAAAGAQLKGVVLELGGKSPLIVFDDADVWTAAEAAVFTAFMNQGQTCTSCARVLVERKAAETFLAFCHDAASKLRIGNPLDPSTQIGPLVSAAQLDRVRSIVGDVQGESLETPHYEPTQGGHFFKPMVVTDYNHGSAFALDEIFGPVMSIRMFDTEEEAYALANDTQYGLAASVWTTSLARSERARRQLEAGIVWINCVHVLSAGTPVSGHKASGLGIEYGLEAADQYMKVKTSVTMAGGWESPFA